MIDTTTLVLAKGLLTAAILLGGCAWQLWSVKRALRERKEKKG
ncbi:MULTISPECIES: hypothetical protein [Ectothiorhodospira]|nr:MULTISPECIES: hypothetical protein [Ectothiorhodospira]